MTFVDYAIVVVFLGLILGLGIAVSRWVGSTEDFFVAGRELRPFLLASTLAATNLCLYNFIGYPGVAYKVGLPILWQEITGMMALVFSGLFILPWLRRLKITTIPEVLRLRYGKGVSIVVCLVTIIRLCGWLGVLLYTMAVLAKGLIGFGPPWVWVIGFAIFTISFTMTGGMWAVVLTDLIQLTIMLGGTLIFVPILMNQVGWLPGLRARLPAEMFQLIPQSGDFNWGYIIAILMLGIQWASTDQGLLQRSFSAVNQRSVAKGMVYTGFLMIPYSILIILPGLVGADLNPGLANGDEILPLLLRNYMPPVVLGIVTAALLSSQISTITANANSVATLFTMDIFRVWINPKASEKTSLLVARLLVLAAGILMVIIAFIIMATGQGAVEFYLNLISIVDMPLFVITILLGLTWQRVNWQGALAGYLGGALCGFLAKSILATPFALTTLSSSLGALLFCVLGTLLFPAGSPERFASVARPKNVETDFHIIPSSRAGKISIIAILAGFALFFVGVAMGANGLVGAGTVALVGAGIYFISSVVRVNLD